jgi:hypothetical protein
MADFCVATKMSPSEYRKITLREFNAFIKALEARGPTLEDLF